MDNDIFTEENYTKEEVRINILWANIFSLFVAVVAIILFGIPFYLIWHEKYQNINIDINISMNLQQRLINSGFILLILIPGIIIHELIHGVFFMIYTKKGLKSIKFGIMPVNKLFTPYCNCIEKIKIKHYRIAVIMPTIIIGIVPAMVSLFIGNLALFIYSIIFIGSGAGDILIIMKTIKEKNNTWVLDYPSECGFYIYRQKFKE